MSNSKQPPSSSNVNSTGFGNSFLQNSSNARTPFISETGNDQFSVDEEGKLNQSIKIWSNNLSHFQHTSHKVLSRNVLLINGCKLFKEN